MKLPASGAIDCDVHLAIPPVKALLPFMSEYWRDQIVTRFIDRSSFALMSYPPRSPLSGRADWRAEAGGAMPGSSLQQLRSQLLEPFGLRLAICHAMHGGMALFNEDMGAEFCSAVNRWVAQEWLDKEPRLRASILVYPQNPQLAVAEIERCASDERFVSVLLPVMGDAPLGRRIYWPIYEAAQRHGLSLSVHAGSTYRHPPTGVGWTSYQIEDYVSQSAAFQNLIISFVAEGVFAKFPELTLVCLESGFTWMPTLLWRSAKTWRGVRTEVPWIDRSPAAIVRERVKLSLRPFDAPHDPAIIARIFEQIDCPEMLVFSTDYPHWQFDGEDALPDGLPQELVAKILFDNPMAAFPRLSGTRPQQAVA
jgi:predicted TIM-barrel fold metal-dependent hydrolase